MYVIEQAFLAEFFFQLLVGQLQRAKALGLHVLDDDLVAAARLLDTGLAAHDDLEPVLRPGNLRYILLLRKHAALSWARSPLSEKYMWPEEWCLKSKISPWIQSAPSLSRICLISDVISKTAWVFRCSDRSKGHVYHEPRAFKIADCFGGLSRPNP